MKHITINKNERQKIEVIILFQQYFLCKKKYILINEIFIVIHNA